MDLVNRAADASNESGLCNLGNFVRIIVGNNVE